MYEKDTITRIEKAVDDSFASKLEDIGYAQAVWTLLSVNEDYSLKVTHQASDLEEMHIFADVHLNALTYPLQRCLKEAASGTIMVDANSLTKTTNSPWIGSKPRRTTLIFAHFFRCGIGRRLMSRSTGNASLSLVRLTSRGNTRPITVL